MALLKQRGRTLLLLLLFGYSLTYVSLYVKTLPLALKFDFVMSLNVMVGKMSINEEKGHCGNDE